MNSEYVNEVSNFWNLLEKHKHSTAEKRQSVVESFVENVFRNELSAKNTISHLLGKQVEEQNDLLLTESVDMIVLFRDIDNIPAKLSYHKSKEWIVETHILDIDWLSVPGTDREDIDHRITPGFIEEIVKSTNEKFNVAYIKIRLTRIK